MDSAARCRASLSLRSGETSSPPPWKALELEASEKLSAGLQEMELRLPLPGVAVEGVGARRGGGRSRDTACARSMDTACAPSV